MNKESKEKALEIVSNFFQELQILNENMTLLNNNITHLDNSILILTKLLVSIYKNQTTSNIDLLSAIQMAFDYLQKRKFY